MTTEHNRRSSDLHVAEINKRGFIIERQEKEIEQLKLLLFDADLCLTYKCAGDPGNFHYCRQVKERIERALSTTPQEG